MPAYPRTRKAIADIIARAPTMIAPPPPHDSVAPVACTVGNIVATGVTLLLLPLIVFYLWFCVAANHGQLMLPSLQMLAAIPAPTMTSLAIVAGWIIFQALLQVYAPGPWVEGTPLADGSRLSYKMNGWTAWWSTWTVLAAGVGVGIIPPTLLADQFGPLLSTANLLALLASVYLYWHGHHITPKTCRIDNVLTDFWLGTALNPRIGRFDLKLFFEARPGLIAWVAIDLSFAAKQYQLYGTVTVPMMLVCAFQFWYVTDYFLNEKSILTTWDIKHEKFGFMLCWGDLVWVPFTYTLQAHYLAEHAHGLPWWGIAAIVLLNLCGYIVFRGANAQKNAFRTNPETPVWGKAAQYIRTARGTLLLTSGWWGLSRHMNYFGDLLMGLAWCLPCLFDSPLPYFYVVYFTILLVHRERRDHQVCAVRYGNDWNAYCAKVPYRIVPWLY